MEKKKNVEKHQDGVCEDKMQSSQELHIIHTKQELPHHPDGGLAPVNAPNRNLAL